MEINEINNIAFQLDPQNGRITKIKILKSLLNGKKNAHEIKRILDLSSYSHITKFLNQLYDLYLVDFEEKVCSNDYLNYVMKKWYLTDLGIEFINFFKETPLTRDITQSMNKERVKRESKKNNNDVTL